MNDVTGEKKISSVLFPAVIFTNVRNASEEFFARDHGIAEYHEETTNHRQITEEKGHVENEAIAEPLNDDNSEKSRDGIFCITLRHDSAGGNKHGLCKQYQKERGMSGDFNHLCYADPNDAYNDIYDEE